MAIRFKGDIISQLKSIGYNTTRIRKENIFGQKTMQDFRTNAEIPYKTINKLCGMLHCQPGDILEYVDDNTDDEVEPKGIMLTEKEQRAAERLRRKIKKATESEESNRRYKH